jgi:hypothetical protein
MATMPDAPLGYLLCLIPLAAWIVALIVEANRGE